MQDESQFDNYQDRIDEVYKSTVTNNTSRFNEVKSGKQHRLLVQQELANKALQKARNNQHDHMMKVYESHNHFGGVNYGTRPYPSLKELIEQRKKMEVELEPPSVESPENVTQKDLSNQSQTDEEPNEQKQEQEEPLEGSGMNADKEYKIQVPNIDGSGMHIGKVTDVDLNTIAEAKKWKAYTGSGYDVNEYPDPKKENHEEHVNEHNMRESRKVEARKLMHVDGAIY